MARNLKTKCFNPLVSEKRKGTNFERARKKKEGGRKGSNKSFSC